MQHARTTAIERSRFTRRQLIDWFADTHDLAPTLLSLSGARPSPDFEGADLSPIADGHVPDEPRDFTYGGYSNHSYVRDDDWAMVTNNERTGAQLYDLHAGSAQRN